MKLIRFYKSTKYENTTIIVVEGEFTNPVTGLVSIRTSHYILNSPVPLRNLIGETVELTKVKSPVLKFDVVTDIKKA